MNHSEPPSRTDSRSRRLTVETFLWALVFSVALLLRVSRLAAAPLAAPEAQEAMVAWRAAMGLPLSTAESYSPLLFLINTPLVWLGVASDVLVRLGPALFGSVLALTPYLLRRRLGRIGALVAGGYLALSPTMLFASRQVSGVAIAALAVMLVLGALDRYLASRRHEWLTVTGVAFGIALTSDGSVYGALAALGLTGMVALWLWPDDIDWALDALRGQAKELLLVGCVVALAVSLALGARLAGIEMIGRLFIDWVRRLRPVVTEPVPLFALLLAYELLVVVGGVVGTALTQQARRGDRRVGVLLAVWAAIAIALLWPMRGRAATDVWWVVLPLTLLTGVAAQGVAESARRRRVWAGEWLYGGIVLLLWLVVWLHLAESVRAVGQSRMLLVQLVQIGVVALMQCVLFVAYVYVDGFASASRSALAATGIVLFLGTLSAGWGVAHVRPADPREILAADPTAPDVRHVVESLRTLSRQRSKEAHTLSLVYEAAPDSVLAWYLRDFRQAERVDDLQQVPPGVTAILTDVDEAPPASEDRYVGRTFDLRQSWRLTSIAGRLEWPPQQVDGIRWYLFREAPLTTILSEEMALWVAIEDEPRGD